jgi:hypothetical protein
LRDSEYPYVIWIRYILNTVNWFISLLG